jgi:PQQ-dependent catabolism-associated CXXCW motif protein
MLSRWNLRLFVILAVSLVISIGGVTSPSAGDANFDAATGYRIARYRAALPDEVPGGKRLYTEDVEKLFKEGEVAFVDVMPSTGAGYHPKTGEWRLRKSRKNIPGSIWLPDVGRGKLNATLSHYFEANLARISNGDKSRALLFYCQSDCWMAWNAVKRAAELGYSKLYWYPEGTDGWTDWDNPIEPSTPVPVTIRPAQADAPGH